MDLCSSLITTNLISTETKYLAYFEQSGYAVKPINANTFQIIKNNVSELVMITNDTEKFNYLQNFEHPSLVKFQMFPLYDMYAIKTKYLIPTDGLDFGTVMYQCCLLFMYLNQNGIGIGKLGPRAITITDNGIFLNWIYLDGLKLESTDYIINNILQLGEFLESTLYSSKYVYKYFKYQQYINNFDSTIMKDVIIMYNKADFEEMLKNETLRKDEAIALEAIKMDPSFYEKIDQSVKNTSFALKALEQNNSVIKYFNTELLKNPLIEKAPIGARYEFDVMKFDKFKNDPRVVRVFVANGYPLYKVIDEFKKDTEIVRAAVEKNSYSFFYASQQLTNDIAFTHSLDLPYPERYPSINEYISRASPIFTAKCAKKICYLLLKYLIAFDDENFLNQTTVKNVDIVQDGIKGLTISSITLCFPNKKASTVPIQQYDETKISTIGKFLRSAFLDGTMIVSQEIADSEIITEINRTLIELTSYDSQKQIQSLVDCIIRFRMGTDPKNYKNNLKSTLESEFLWNHVKIVQNIVRRFPSLKENVHQAITPLIKIPKYEEIESESTEILLQLIRKGYPLQYHTHKFVGDKSSLVIEALKNKESDFSTRFIAEKAYFEETECLGKKRKMFSADDVTTVICKERKVELCNTNMVELFLQKEGFNLKPVGLGGFSKVLHISKGEKVSALKITNNTSMTLSEVISLSRLSALSSLFVRVHNCFIISGFTCIEMEYISCGTLREVMDNYKISVKGSKLIVMQLFEALHLMNQVGIVHGDLKPHNILVRDIDKLSIAICDFGFSRHTNSLREETMVGGTKAYMAPELFQSFKVNFQTDLFSVGIIIRNILRSVTCKDITEETDPDLNLLEKISTGLTSHNPEIREKIFQMYSNSLFQNSTMMCIGSDIFPTDNNLELLDLPYEQSTELQKIGKSELSQTQAGIDTYFSTFSGLSDIFSIYF